MAAQNQDRHEDRHRAGRARSRRRAAWLAGWIGVALFFAHARAAETQWWTIDSPSDYAKSESRGVVVTPEGALELGPAAAVGEADSVNTIWALAALKDGSVAIACDHGRIDRWTSDGGIKRWIKLPVGQVLSLANDGDGLVAGTGPEGLVYHVSARGDTARVANTGERYVWALARGPGESWYAATGTRGRLLSIDHGRVKIVIDTDESNLVSLIADGKGGAFTGGDSKGRVLHARANGSTRTVFDASEDEVRALALAPDGTLYAAALSAAAVSGEDSEEGAEKMAPAKSAVSGGRAVVYQIVPDSSAASLWTSPQPFVFALATTPQGVVAATGNRAGLYLLGPSGTATQWMAAPQGQITALVTDSKGRLYAGTSNPGALWRIGPERASRGELKSTVLDARRIARFGRILWRGETRGGSVELETRSGNTDTPDTTWSAWQGGGSGAEGFKIASPPARYLQWKITLAGGSPRIESVETAWREQNLPPRLDELTVAPQGDSFREGDLTPRIEPVTQTLPGGQKVSYSVTPSSTSAALRALPMWARGVRTAQWKASDPNGDPLKFRVEIRREDGGEWTKLADSLDDPAYTWDTTPLPDGRYRLRVIASDREGNAIGEERSAEIRSEPFTVDNTPPTITGLEAKAEARRIRVETQAEDHASALSRIEVSLDDGDWRTVTPEGGLADGRELKAHAVLDPVEPGEHTVGVRAVDQAGNSVIRSTRVTVPRSR